MPFVVALLGLTSGRFMLRRFGQRDVFTPGGAEDRRGGASRGFPSWGDPAVPNGLTGVRSV